MEPFASTEAESRRMSGAEAPSRTTREARRELRLASIALAVAAWGFACGQGALRESAPARAPEEAPVPGGTLRVLQDFAASLDPVFADDVYETTVLHQIYETLVTLDPSLGVVPGLAEQWVVSSDGRRYTFRLRPELRFHDGTPLDAACVTASLERVLAPNKPAPSAAESYLMSIKGADSFRAGHSKSVEGLRAVDNRTVEIELSTPMSFFLAVLCMDQCMVVPRTVGRDWQRLERAPCGTGPFRFSERDGTGSVHLVRNDRYWGSRALLDSLTFVCRGTPSGARVASLLLRRQVDAASVSSAERPLLVDLAGLRLTETPELSLTFIGINTQRPPFDRVEARRALLDLMRREDLPEGSGRSVVFAEGILPPGMPGREPHRGLWHFDPAAAAERLRGVGIQPGTSAPLVVVSTSHNLTPSDSLWAKPVRRLKSLGVPVRIETLSWPELDGRVMAGEAQLFTMSWIADVPDPDAVLTLLFRSGEPNNMFGYQDARTDSLLDAARVLPPGPDRYRTYREAEERILEQVPIIPLYHEMTSYVWQPEVHGIEVSPLGMALVRFDRVWFKPETSGPDLAAEASR